MTDDIPYPRFASRGHAYVYVLPCRDEDLLKVGFSREPFRRFHTLHRRFFEFFDLDRGLLIAVDRLADARRIERQFITTWADNRAPAPLVVPLSAAGHTEWYRGIHAEVTACAREIAARDNHSLHEPLRPWLRHQLQVRADVLFDWSTRMLELVEYEQFNRPPDQGGRPYRQALLDTLDMYAGIGLPLADLLPAAVLDWYGHGDHRTIFG
jgi:T5orf172 domain